MIIQLDPDQTSFRYPKMLFWDDGNVFRDFNKIRIQLFDKIGFGSDLAEKSDMDSSFINNLIIILKLNFCFAGYILIQLYNSYLNMIILLSNKQCQISF